MDCPEELYYTKDHEWVMENGDVLTVGITDYAQDELGDVVFVELPETGKAVKAGEPFGVVESVKSVSDLYSPLSGEVVEINSALEKEPELVNTSPYKDGWMIKIKTSNKDETKTLMSAQQYIEYVKSL